MKQLLSTKNADFINKTFGFFIEDLRNLKNIKLFISEFFRKKMLHFKNLISLRRAAESLKYKM